MTDKRDICERLEDQSIDGAIYLRFNAAKEIRYLRYYVARLEGDLAKEEFEHAKTKIALRKAQEHISDQAIDIVTLGQEVGRLREALKPFAKAGELFCIGDEHLDMLIYAPAAGDEYRIVGDDLKRARAALAEQGDKK